LANYCLELKKGETVYVVTTYLAEPLIQLFHEEALKAGANPYYNIGLPDMNKIFFEHAELHQLEFPNPLSQVVFDKFDAYIVIRAPFDTRETANVDLKKRKIRQATMKKDRQTYFKRIADGTMKRSLCEFPTASSAEQASKSLEEYEHFVFNACYLFEENPEAKWLEVRKYQQGLVDYLNNIKDLKYISSDIDISFSVKDRTWINSDGRSNMPSGEVFSAPVEDSVNGHIKFSVPTTYNGNDINDLELKVENGEVISWNATKGKDILDSVLSVPGAKRFGEVAIGTNYNIQEFTRNILFDEKVGGTVHMALGQSYYQCGGKNNSSVHWDLIADMKNGGEIYADDELIYQNGKFLIS